jgi:hypothetical protein
MTVIHNDTYTLLELVKQVHSIPHLNSALQKESNEFDVSTDSAWNDYTRSLLPMPIICMSVALLMLFIFQIASCCTCCGKNNNNLPKKPEIGLRKWRIALIVILVIALVFDQGIIYGNHFLSSGISKADDSLNYLQDTFTSLDDYGNVLLKDGNKIQIDFQKSYDINNCAASSTLQDYFEDYFVYVNDYQSYVEDIPDKCSSAQDSLHLYGESYKNKTIWAFYAVFIVSIAVYAFIAFISSQMVLCCGMFTTHFLLTFTFLLCGVQMFIVVSNLILALFSFNNIII